jgi:ComF family protein
MLMRGLKELARGVAQLLLPNACLVCDVPEGDRTDFRHGLCNDCRRSVSFDPFPACPSCAANVGPHTDTTHGCGTCRSLSLGFEGAIRLGPYDGRLREAILRMKDAAGEGLAEALGRVFADVACARWRTESIGLVAPVPLHWRRRWARGYNQSAAVARELATQLGTEFAPHALKRIRHTPRQVGASAMARRENVRGAFRANSGARLANQTVLLVDDVMTTGSTLAEAAKTLKDAGARRVLVAVLARAEAHR